ncbi:MAG: hypothetical protein F4W93_13255 [Dehalococcoidia bacterium]|nr:hypothetical protein [Dehalococcoidia bacterium]
MTAEPVRGAGPAGGRGRDDLHDWDDFGLCRRDEIEKWRATCHDTWHDRRKWCQPCLDRWPDCEPAT